MKKSVKKLARGKHTNILYLTVVLLLTWSRCSLHLPVLPGLYVQSPAMERLHTSPSNDPALLRSLETQDLSREATGPQKAQVVTPQPWQSWPVWHPKPFSCHPRRRGGKASQLPEQGSRSQWVLSELPAIQNSEKWIRTSALAVMWRCKWLSRLGCITPDKYFSSQPLTLSICFKNRSSLFVDLVDILVRDSANQGSWKNRLSFFLSDWAVYLKPFKQNRAEETSSPTIRFPQRLNLGL